MTDSNRRKTPRKPWDSRIQYRIMNPDLPNDDGLSLPASTLNISAGGICIETYYPLQKGMIVRLGPDDVAGVVQWSRKFDNTYKIGIKFI